MTHIYTCWYLRTNYYDNKTKLYYCPNWGNVSRIKITLENVSYWEMNSFLSLVEEAALCFYKNHQSKLYFASQCASPEVENHLIPALSKNFTQYTHCLCLTKDVQSLWSLNDTNYYTSCKWSPFLLKLTATRPEEFLI